jgi:hypothetical protein
LLQQVDFTVTLPVRDSAEAVAVGQTIVNELVGYLGTQQQAVDLGNTDPSDPLINVTLNPNSVTPPVAQPVLAGVSKHMQACGIDTLLNDCD